MCAYEATSPISFCSFFLVLECQAYAHSVELTVITPTHTCPTYTLQIHSGGINTTGAAVAAAVADDAASIASIEKLTRIASSSSCRQARIATKVRVCYWAAMRVCATSCALR